jgi:uncharacterized protein
MSATRLSRMCGAVFGLLFSSALLPGQSSSYRLQDHYEKRGVMIPMRDGVRLFTILYVPKDTSRPYPFLLNRDAYGVRPYGPANYRPWAGPYLEFSREGFIFVYQDVRGRFKSEGDFIHHDPIVPGSSKPGESTDTYDTIEWLLANVPNNNGRVSQRGVSWTGWETAIGMIRAHPALKLSSPQAPPQDQFFGDDYHSGGAFELAYAFNWMAENARVRSGPTEQGGEPFAFPTPDGYRFFMELGSAANATKYFGEHVPAYDDFMAHGTYDEYWRSRNIPQHLVGVTHPVLIVGGWFDAEDFAGPFHMFRGLEAHSPGNQAHLVVGPWDHGGWARNAGNELFGIPFGESTGADFRNHVELPVFRQFLKGGDTVPLPKALMFETGGNHWRGCEEWPPKSAVPTRLYFGADRRASFEPPPASVTPSFDQYLSDPRAPVPYTTEITTSEGRRWVLEDQRFAASRPDVLVYRTAPFERDLTIAGPVAVELYASTSGTDSDWVVKVIDEYPPDARDPEPNPLGLRMGGYQMLLVGDILRGKFRDDFTRPSPMVPGRTTRLRFQLGDRYHTFLKGHSIVMQVQSSWFPMFDRNPQTFVDIYHARPTDYRVATERLFRSGRTASHLVLPVVAGGGCPVTDIRGLSAR